MKGKRKIIMIISAGLAALALAACGGSGSDAAGTEELPGSYTLSAMVRDGEETPAEDIALLEEKGLDCSLTLEADGSGTLDLFGEEKELAWDEESITTGEKTYQYTLAEGQLVITDGDSSLTFLREE